MIYYTIIIINSSFDPVDGKTLQHLVDTQFSLKWTKIKYEPMMKISDLIIYTVLVTTDAKSLYACSFCSMLATSPLVSTEARIGLLK